LRKIIIILILGIITISCSVTRNSGTNNYKISNNLISANILESVRNQNITNGSFIISRADIEILNVNGKEKFIGLIKYEYPDKYLISLKSRSGIEGIRAYISEDSILVNDRINKKLYIGTSFYLRKKFGLNKGLLPLVLGDIVLDKKMGKVEGKCIEDKFKIENLVGGILLHYDIDCKKRKTILVSQINNVETQGIKIKYGNFSNVGDILTPRLIELEDAKTNTAIKIKIVKIERPWNGKIEFIRGRGYELIELL
jgi:Domain of unknown function (DUF4292)